MPGFLRTYATVIELHTEANHNHLYCMDSFSTARHAAHLRRFCIISVNLYSPAIAVLCQSGPKKIESTKCY